MYTKLKRGQREVLGEPPQRAAQPTKTRRVRYWANYDGAVERHRIEHPARAEQHRTDKQETLHTHG